MFLLVLIGLSLAFATSDQGQIVLTAQVGWGDSVDLHWNIIAVGAQGFAGYRISRIESIYPTLTTSNLTHLFVEPDRNITTFVDRTVAPRTSYFYRIEVLGRSGEVLDADTIRVTTWPLGAYPSAWPLGTAIVCLGLAFILGVLVPILFPESKIGSYFSDRMFRLLALSFSLLIAGLLLFGLGL
jgi:hypothetical protein